MFFSSLVDTDAKYLNLKKLLILFDQLIAFLNRRRTKEHKTAQREWQRERSGHLRDIDRLEAEAHSTHVCSWDAEIEPRLCVWDGKTPFEKFNYCEDDKNHMLSAQKDTQIDLKDV